MPIIGAAIAERTGVKVRVGGDRACTDGQTILVPSIDVTAPGARDKATAFVLHEAFHINHTDFSAGTHPRSPFVHQLYNRIEDPRIEMCGARRFAGARAIFIAATTTMVREGAFGAPSDQRSLPEAVLDYCLFHQRLNVAGQGAFAELCAARRDQLLKLIDPDMVDQLDALLDTGHALKDSQDAFDLAMAITRLLSGAAAKDGDQGHAEKREPDDESSDESSGDEPSTAGGDHRPGDGKTEADDGQSASDEGHCGQSSADQGSGVADRSTADEPACDQSDATLFDPDGLSEDELGADLTGAYAAAVTQLERSPYGPSKFVGPFPTGEPSDEREAAQRLSAPMRARLRALLMADQRRSRLSARSGRRLKRNRLARVASGNLSVFKATRFVRTNDVAIHLLLDRSRSMVERMDTALDATYATALGLDALSDVTVAVSAFPHSKSDVLRLTCPGERVEATSHRYNLVAAGGTPLESAIWPVLSELAMSRQTRRILVVITDGWPDNPLAVGAALKEASALGIETCAIGLHVAVHRLFEYRAMINTLQDLPGAAFAMFRQMMRYAA